MEEKQASSFKVRSVASSSVKSSASTNKAAAIARAKAEAARAQVYFAKQVGT